MKCKVFSITQNHNLDLLKLQNKMCIVATKHQKLLQEIDDVLFISNGYIGCRTRAKCLKDCEKLNLLAKTDVRVSQRSIMQKFCKLFCMEKVLKENLSNEKSLKSKSGKTSEF